MPQICIETKTAGRVGGAFPYGKDPEDKNVRIAPSFAPLGEVKQAAELLCLCAKMACTEKLLA